VFGGGILIRLEGLPLGGNSEVTCWWVREMHAAQRAGLRLIPLCIKKQTKSEVKKSENIVKVMVGPIKIIQINIYCKILIQLLSFYVSNLFIFFESVILPWYIQNLKKIIWLLAFISRLNWVKQVHYISPDMR